METYKKRALQKEMKRRKYKRSHADYDDKFIHYAPAREKERDKGKERKKETEKEGD